MILITSTGRLRQKDSPIVETSWATELRSCLKNATHSQKPKPITLIKRVKYLAVPGKGLLEELLQLLPGQPIVHIADLDVNTIRKRVWAVSTAAGTGNIESKWRSSV